MVVSPSQTNYLYICLVNMLYIINHVYFLYTQIGIWNDLLTFFNILTFYGVPAHQLNKTPDSSRYQT